MGGLAPQLCNVCMHDGFKVIAGCGPTREFYTKWLDEQKTLGIPSTPQWNVGDWESTVEAFSKTKASTAASMCW